MSFGFGYTAGDGAGVAASISSAFFFIFFLKAAYLYAEHA
jgi:hypothetical protein